MESNKIIVDFTRVKNVLIAEIIEFPSSLRGAGTIIESEKYKLASACYTMLCSKTLFLTGCLDKRATRVMSYDYGTDEEAQAALESFSELIAAYNRRDAATGVVKGEIYWRRAE